MKIKNEQSLSHLLNNFWTRLILEISILLLTYFVFGEGAVFYSGALLFFFSGYQPFIRMKTVSAIIQPFITTLVFFIFLFLYLTYKHSNEGEIVMPNVNGFIMYFIIFSVSYLIGSSINLFIKNNDVRQMVFLTLLALLISRVSIFFGKPFFSSFSGVLYFLFSLHLFRKTKINKLLIIVSLTIPFFCFYVLLSPIKEVPLAVFLYVFFCVLLSYFLFNFTKTKSKKHPVLFAISILLIFSILNFGFTMNWTEYIYNKNTLLPKESFSEVFFDLDGQEVTMDDFEGKIVVLDLWTTSCGVCFKKFPEFEKFYQDNKEREDILIYAVNLPFKDESGEDNRQMIDKFGYDFPVLIANNDLYHFTYACNITGVPAIIIIDKNGKVVYNKSLNNNPVVLVNNLQRMVDGLSEKPLQQEIN